MYKIGGGLEKINDDPSTLEIDGIKYVVSDKFRTMLRDSFIDWGTFLEIYNQNLSYEDLFNQSMKLLNIKENENLRESLVPLLKKIYELPSNIHMACMLKQFMIHEPISAAIHALFTTIKNHYETIVERFITARNKYIIQENLKDKKNDIEKLLKYWSDQNDQLKLETSSLILRFLHPPKGIMSGLNFNISGKESVIENLKHAVKAFNYPGFCPKVPRERLAGLLQFPINEFVKAIQAIDPEALFPNYKHLEELVSKIIAEAPKKPDVPDDVKRDTPPETSDNMELAKWYIESILDLRKQLLPYGGLFEDYYAQNAKLIRDINEEYKKEITHMHKI